ncbi:MAG: SGNH/GDSL hydrolase family protein [Acidobacteriota bacterium]|nr:SGNH/GDSL hydrolase family protein [Acidobacteriota bacterium]
MKQLASFLVAACILSAQAPAPSPLLNNQQAVTLYTRSIQLMESTMFAVPDLQRAAAPLLENARQQLANIKVAPGNSLYTYNFLSNTRAYLVLSDSVSKPYPFPEEGQKQFTELRDSASRIESHFRALVEQKDRQLRNPDPDNLGRYSELDARVGPSQPGKPRVVFLGDSITDAWRLNEYFPDRDFVNRGISGQTTSQMLGRMKPDVTDLHPAAVLILAGTNDLARGTSVGMVETNITAICDLADFHHVKVILSTVLPVSDYHKSENPAYEMTRQRPPELIRSLNSWMQSFCAQRNYTFLDYYSEMVDASGFMKADLANDGLHPNSGGYRIMAPLALAAINRTTVQSPVQQKQRKRRLFMKSDTGQ